MKMAVVHDYFTQLGGAEKVAEELYRMLPRASLLALATAAGCVPDSLKEVNIQASWMQSMPGIAKYYRLYFMLYPLAVRTLDLSGYDLVLSSSSGYTKGIQTGRDSMHVCYCHTPMRWVWDLDRYSEKEGMTGASKAVLLRVIAILRSWDVAAARQPDHFIANSQTVANRIRKIYNRHAEIVNPPIDVSRFRESNDLEDYYVVLSRLISYKRIDLAVRACSRLGRKLLVIGDGPHRQALEAQAGASVAFCGRLPDVEVEYHVSRCRALIFPGEEDFGMAPLEVAAAGRPCIAYRAGGATETIVEGVTGSFFDVQDAEHLMEAIEAFERCSWSPTELRRHAEGFSIEVFREKMRSFLMRAGVPSRELSLFDYQEVPWGAAGHPFSDTFYGWN